jgi:hypothetical protein
VATPARPDAQSVSRSLCRLQRGPTRSLCRAACVDEAPMRRDADTGCGPRLPGRVSQDDDYISDDCIDQVKDEYRRLVMTILVMTVSVMRSWTSVDGRRLY